MNLQTSKPPQTLVPTKTLMEHMQDSMKVSINDTAGLQKRLRRVDVEKLKQIVVAHDTRRFKLDHAVADLTQSTPTDGDNNTPSASADPQNDEIKESTVSVANATPSGAPTSDLAAHSHTSPLALQSSPPSNPQESDKRYKHSSGHKKRRRRKHGHSECIKAPVRANFVEAIDWEPEPSDYLKSKSQPAKALSNIVRLVSNSTQAKNYPAAGYIMQDSVKARMHAPLNTPPAHAATSPNHQADRKLAKLSISRQHAISASTSTTSPAISNYESFGTQQYTGVVQGSCISPFSQPGFLAPAQKVTCNMGHHHVPGRDFCYNYETRQYYTPIEPCDFMPHVSGNAAKPSSSSQPGFLAPARKETCNMGHHHVPGRDFCYNYETRQYYTPKEPCDFERAVLGSRSKPPLSTTHPLAHLNPPIAPRSMLENQNNHPSDAAIPIQFSYATTSANATYRGYEPEGHNARSGAERAEEFGRDSKKRKYDN